ncbi:MAG: tetratricopeptide repeat protein, partial [Phycisphaerales bacterium]|nr:tetratricopeptide repeat protein [Phycisphaerales bacterium]
LANNLAILGPIIERKGDLPGAEQSYRDALDILHEAHGDEHPEIGRVMMRLGRNLGLQDRLDEADATLRAARDMQQRLLGQDHSNVGSIAGEIANIAMKREQFNVAAEFFAEQLRIFEKRLPPAHPRATLAQIRLGSALIQVKNFADAEAALKTAYEAAKPTPTTSVAGTNLLDAARAALIELYTITDRGELAAAIRAEKP